MNVKNIAICGAKALIALAAGAVALEASYHGANMLHTDAKTIKEAIDPTPVYVKDGWFKKKKVTINPFTGNIKDYTGDKEPDDKTVYKLK